MTDVVRSSSFVRWVAAVSGMYDIAVGLCLLLAADRFAALFGVAPARPPIFADLNGLFLLAVGVGKVGQDGQLHLLDEIL